MHDIMVPYCLTILEFCFCNMNFTCFLNYFIFLACTFLLPSSLELINYTRDREKNVNAFAIVCVSLTKCLQYWLEKLQLVMETLFEWFCKWTKFLGELYFCEGMHTFASECKFLDGTQNCIWKYIFVLHCLIYKTIWYINYVFGCSRASSAN